MARPSWQEFANLFTTLNKDEQLAVTEQIIASHPLQLSGYTAEEDYAELFYELFAILLDWRETTVELIERCSEQLGEEVLAIVVDGTLDPSETGQFEIIYKGNRHLLKYASSGINEDDFDDTIRQLESILADEFYLKLFTRSLGDTLEFLIIPISYWLKAEQRYGKAQLALQFISYDDPSPLIAESFTNASGQRQAPISYCIDNLPQTVVAGIKQATPTSHAKENTVSREPIGVWQRYKKALLIVVAIMLCLGGVTLIFVVASDRKTTEKVQVDCLKTIDNAVRGLSTEQANRAKQLMKKQLNCQ